ncbi:MAG: aminotransferase class I/II-fold pyridoxal phosphate-dependent enzyme [Bacteroidia bacterium]|nr:aminotransferase class I/II-fold pyridoxal phosphate-dependent enzyme [Bacteroidia bacterium]
MIQFQSKLPSGGKTIFSVISALAKEHNAINLGQGFPNFDGPNELKELVKKYLDAGKNQYAPMPGIIELRQALANKAHYLYGKNINPDNEITITAGATQAIFTIISAFVHSEDEVIIIEPAYDSYRPSIELTGASAIPYELEGPEYIIDWEIMQSLVTAKTRMIIINTPQNPIGKTLKEEDMLKLQSLVTGSNIIVLSDEVYEQLVFDGKKHESVLRYPELYDRSLAVYSFGKTFHSTGWKVGYCVAPPHLMKEFRKIHQWNVFSVNSFVQYALADFLTRKEHYLELSSFFEKKRDFLTHAMGSSKLKALSSEGTYFQLYDYSGISDKNDIDFARELITSTGVAAIPVSPFYASQRQDKVIRLCFAKTEETLSRAAEKLSRL